MVSLTSRLLGLRSLLIAVLSPSPALFYWNHVKLASTSHDVLIYAQFDVGEGGYFRFSRMY